MKKLLLISLILTSACVNNTTLKINRCELKPSKSQEIAYANCLEFVKRIPGIFPVDCKSHLNGWCER
jgi:hypothetical protein